ncbi:hypothetical protein J8281_10510 [Aquimarina sp. U1-2]|uniref:hypothetical protein n=1 Tax=Aquimarina sp. U1-2 TaxID=2823141 RepID=UPI001AED0E6E|nr:hypothetical protein [Aquimarina sp. U1-2]MBP2832616.1 hypothetical protein [Aquimarina sp. U1-2]
MWFKKEKFAIGGLREMGFKPNTDILMLLSSQGRGIFDCIKAEKIERDSYDYYMEEWDEKTRIVQGFGKFKDEVFICGGFEAKDPIKKETKDGWKIKIKQETRLDYRKVMKEAEVMYLVNNDKRIEIDVFHYGIDRAYGFSDTGNSFVLGISSDLYIWSRSKHIQYQEI